MSATETSAAPAEAPKGPVIELIPLGQNLARVVLTISNQGSLARFQQEIQTLGQQFGRIQQLQQRIQSALTTVERDALTKVGEAEVKDFAEKDAVFAKVWGFNIPAVANRQATFVNTALRLFAVVSEEEAAKARASADFKEEQLVVRGDRRLLQTAEIRGLDLVIQFDQFAKVLQARRDAVIQLTELQKRSTNDEEKTRIQTQLDQTLELLNKGNKEMAESVGYSITHNYEVEVLESKFVILLNQEEVNQVQGLFANAQQQQAAAAAAVAPAVEAPKLEKKADKKN
jgi:ribosomal protein L12E/L44/L45/RPP1/RPP2